MARGKLLVEIKTEELLVEVASLVREVGRKCDAAIHLEKAANSAYFNIGEGTVLFQPRAKAGKYNIARAEANEVRRALRALVLTKKLSEQRIPRADDLADCIIAMLTNMIKNLEARM